MATSSRQSAIFGVNDWKTIYQTFRQADFQSYDYETLRKSFVDYLRTYYPETFNDYVESSEFIALLDVMAFMGQALAFRGDLNARENFIDTAERRDSVVKLANLVSYTPKRNYAGQGYIKIIGVQTTENVNDINNINLSRLPIIWNDPANVQWQQQFNTVINAALIDSQRVGRPGNSKMILGIKTDEYSISIPPNSLPVLPFTTIVDGNSMNFELVSVTSLNKDYIYEIPPDPNSRFNILYRNDKLGFGSPNTGFFAYFKQGALQTFDFNIAQQISNQVVDVDIQGINNEDTWLYEVDSTTNTTTQWNQVENVYTGSNQTELLSSRKIFSVTSRFNDQVSYIFGDGVFSEIPVGNFRAYVRSGNALQYTVDPSEMQSINIDIGYISRVGRLETLTLTLELQVPVTNAQTRETLSQIKERAPSKYYTQNRMVNGEDYNNFPFGFYSSIIKSKAVNRSSIGASRNLDLLDPTGKYSSTNSFGDDGALYQDTTDGNFVLSVADENQVSILLRTQQLLNLLASYRVTQYYLQNGLRYSSNPIVINSVNKQVFWKELSVGGVDCTGYMYYMDGTTEVPLPVGEYSNNVLKYISNEAYVKFLAPSGYYFDESNKLVAGIPGPSNKRYFWTNILNVIGDGYNNGQGSFNDGTGPISLYGIVPSGVIVDTIIPSFNNTLSNALVQEIIGKLDLQESFCLIYDNTLLSNQERWSIVSYPNPNSLVDFISTGNLRYNVLYRSLVYYFGSVSDTRFSFDSDKIVFDPKSGKLIKDFINVLKTNSQYNSSNSLNGTVTLSIIGQTIEADGYPDNYAVEIASLQPDNLSLIRDPDFFQTITGYQTGKSTLGKYTFFRTITDSNLLSRQEIVPNSSINYSYPNKTQIELVKYEFPVGQIFYAYSENTFYSSRIASTYINTIELVQLTNYNVKTGRQGLAFQYRHNSNNTTRINPGTTNIIDLYLVTQAYYTAYNNWLTDTTGTVPKPSQPTIAELMDSYGGLDQYKMISDSLVMHSVQFKPLFGEKADPKLRATIKVIKSGSTTASDSEIRSAILTNMNTYFSISNWDFGSTFYFSELAAYLHSQLGDFINSVVLVPNDPSLSFGALYEIKSAPFEIFVNGATASDIVVITALTPSELTP